MSWRPDGWKNPYPEQYELISGYTDKKKSFVLTTTKVKEAYEEGADAMLKALRKDGYPSKEGYAIMKGDVVIQSTRPGTWVFIPTGGTEAGGN